MTDRDPVEELRHLLETSSRAGGGVELLLASMAPDEARLLRLCAIPHELDAATLRILAPELDEQTAQARFADLARLSVMIGAGPVLAMHDEARDHLFGWWLAPDQAQGLIRASESLVHSLTRRLASAPQDTREAMENERLFHWLGWDPAAGLVEFERLFDQARHSLKLSRCATLIRLAREYGPVLDQARRLWLDYQEAKLALDQHRPDAARVLLDAVLSQDELPVPLRIKCLRRRGHVDTALGQHRAASDHYRQALKLTAGPEHRAMRCALLHDLATALRDDNRPSEAQTVLNDAIDTADQAGDHGCLADCYNSLGTLQLRLGDVDAAIHAYGRCMEELDRTAETFRQAQVQNNLGSAHLRRGEPAQAESYLHASLAIKQQAGDSAGQAATLNNLVQVYRQQGRPAEAFAAAARAIALFESIHDQRQAGIGYRNLGRLHRENDRPDLARDAFDKAMECFRAFGSGADDEVNTTQADIAALGNRSGIPWWAWGSVILVLVFGSLLVLGWLVTLQQGDDDIFGAGHGHRAIAGSLDRWAIGYQDGGSWYLDLDGERQGPFDEILADSPVVSGHGTRIAFGTRVDGRWQVHLDGTVLATHEALVPGGLAFSPDGTRFAYAARDGDTYRVYENGQAGDGFDEVFPSTLMFSPDGRRLSFRARSGEKRTLVVDGVPGPWFDRISLSPWVFSPNSQRIAYAVQDGEARRMIIDGEPGPAYDAVANAVANAAVPVFSPDSRRTGYFARREGAWRLVLDGSDGPRFEDARVGASLFSPDSTRVAYGVQRQGRWRLILDDEERGDFDPIYQGTPLFSPNSQRLAYDVGQDGGQRVVVDGGGGPTVEGTLIGTPQFSPDSKRLAYGFVRQGKWWMRVDDDEYGPYGDIRVSGALFSPDSRHLAYAVQDGGRWSLVVDGEPRQTHANMTAPVFHRGMIRYLVTQERGGMRTGMRELPIESTAPASPP